MGHWLELVSTVPFPVLIAVDLDDTLLMPDSSLSPRAAHDIQRLRMSHTAVIPLTARRPSDVTDLFQGTDVGPLAVVSNGAAIWDLEEDALLSEEPLPASVVADIIQQMRHEIPGVVLGLEHLDDLVCEPWLIEVLGPSDEHSCRMTDDLNSVIDQPVSKLICWHPEIDAGALTLATQQVVGATATAVTTGGRWVEVLHPRANKGEALLRVCSLLDIPPVQVISISNDANDLPMMRIAGVSLAVANATPEVLELADGILPSNADEGVAIMLEALTELIESRRGEENAS
jgi:Cof subfamily protein (haloacid dehalogenase superfamily)